MATPKAQMNLNGLARKLVLDGLLSEPDALKAQSEATKKKLPLVSHLVESKLVASKELANAVPAIPKRQIVAQNNTKNFFIFSPPFIA